MKFQPIILFVFLAGFTERIYTCLTWDINGTSLELTCRLHNFVQEVSIKNPNKEKVAACNFEEEIANCASYQKHGRITSDFIQLKVVLTLDNIGNYVNGEWTCVQGENKFKTVVSTIRGIISATALSFVAQYMDPDKVKLTCSSCREPHRNYVEFLIDGRSVDSMSYDHDTSQCKRGNENCTLDVCSCSTTGNEFTRVFIIDNDKNWQNFTCEMRFIDRSQLYRFLQKATLQFNGSAFKSIFNETRKTKEAEKVFVPSIEINDTLNTSTPTNVLVSTTKKDTVGETGDTGKIIGIVVGLLLIIVVAVAVLLCRKYRNEKKAEYKKKESPITDGELTPIIGAFSRKDESCRSIETGAISRKDESSPLIAISDTDERKDMLQKRPSENKHESYCEPCFVSFKETVALHWCVECSERLCHQCKKNHSYMKLCRGHIVISIDEVPENYCLSLVLICEEHEQKNREYICMDHNELYCKECLDAKHKTCKTMLLLLYDIESDLPRLIEQQMSQITQSLKLLEESKAECFEIKEYCRLEAIKIENSVAKEIDNLSLNKGSIRLRKRSMISKLSEEWRRLTSTTILEIEKDINSLENHVVLVNEQKKFIDFTIRYCSKMQLLILIYSKIKPVLRDVNDQIQQINNTQKERSSNLELRQQHQMQVAIEVEKPPSAILASDNRNQTVKSKSNLIG